MIKAGQRIISAACVLSILAGCANIQKSGQTVDARQQEAATHMAEASKVAVPAGVTRTKRPRITGDEVLVRTSAELPDAFNNQFSYSTQGAQSFSEVIGSISSLVKMSIRANEVLTVNNPARSNAPGASAQMGMPGAISNDDSDSFEKSIKHFQLNYTGTLKGLMDELSARADASWRYVPRTNTIEFFRYQTKTLSVYLPAGAKNVTASISLTKISGGEGGAGNVAVNQEMKIDPWTSLMQGITSILNNGVNPISAPGQTSEASKGGVKVSGALGQASSNPELGLITVTARPYAVERVTSYIDSINARFSQNVQVDVRIFNITMDNNSSAGFSLDGLYKKLDSYGVSVVGNPILQPSAGSPGQLRITNINPNARLNGATAVAEALAAYGKVALQTQGQVIAINGQPAPIQVASEFSYLASSSTTTTPNIGATTTLTPGTRVVGFTANFLPLILGDNRILLQYQMQISALAGLDTVTSGNTSIQTPRISSQTLQQSALVRDGEAIVLFGFDQDRNQVNSSRGIGGASDASLAQRQMMVVVMQINAGRKGEF